MIIKTFYVPKYLPTSTTYLSTFLFHFDSPTFYINFDFNYIMQKSRIIVAASLIKN